MEARLLEDMGRIGPFKITPGQFVVLLLWNAKNRFEVTVESIDRQEWEQKSWIHVPTLSPSRQPFPPSCSPVENSGRATALRWT
jgi:hypothetical protein